jgi:hypothetical protein
MIANCLICKLDVPSSMAILKCCNHIGHARCIKKFVNDHGRCPNNDCAKSANIDDVISIICDPPQQQPKNSQNNEV